MTVLKHPSWQPIGCLSRGGLRRFSFIGEKRPPARRPLHIPLQDVIRKPFEATLNRLEGSASLLSTSTGVRFNPPKILVDLAAKEKTTQSRLLTADERIALNSLLSWDGKGEACQEHLVLFGTEWRLEVYCVQEDSIIAKRTCDLHNQFRSVVCTSGYVLDLPQC